MKRFGRTDANQRVIVEGLREMGCSVQSLASVGQGCPDLLVGFRGFNWLFEVKDPEKDRAHRKLTRAEKAWHDAWSGNVSIVESVDDAIRRMNLDLEGRSAG